MHALQAAALPMQLQVLSALHGALKCTAAPRNRLWLVLLNIEQPTVKAW
jgi:hypothetical protein